MDRKIFCHCFLFFLLILLGYSLTTSAEVKDPVNEKQLALQIGNQLLKLAPMADPGDLEAFNKASEELTTLVTDYDIFLTTVRWGDRKAESGYNPDNNHLTLFDSLVFLKLYLATFMFESKPQVQQEAEYTILTMNIKFRYQLDPGYLPYPFWHSEKKWKAYHFSKKLEFVFKNNKILCVYRSPDWDNRRPFVDRKFDGRWNWVSTDGKTEPHVTLFSRIFSADNPYVKDLDQTFRELESKSRQQRCLLCHLPNNPSNMSTLILLNYPNQSLGAREKLVEVFQKNRMPPKMYENQPAGIHDEKTRNKLLELAKKFLKLADKAFEYDFKRK